MGLLRTIGYIVLFYFVIRILRNFFDPIFFKNVGQPKTPTPKKEKESVGEFIDYEEVN